MDDDNLAGQFKLFKLIFFIIKITLLTSSKVHVFYILYHSLGINNIYSNINIGKDILDILYDTFCNLKELLHYCTILSMVRKTLLSRCLIK